MRKAKIDILFTVLSDYERTMIIDVPDDLDVNDEQAVRDYIDENVEYADEELSNVYNEEVEGYDFYTPQFIDELPPTERSVLNIDENEDLTRFNTPDVKELINEKINTKEEN